MGRRQHPCSEAVPGCITKRIRQLPWRAPTDSQWVGDRCVPTPWGIWDFAIVDSGASQLPVFRFSGWADAHARLLRPTGRGATDAPEEWYSSPKTALLSRTGESGDQSCGWPWQRYTRVHSLRAASPAPVTTATEFPRHDR